VHQLIQTNGEVKQDETAVLDYLISNILPNT